MELRTATMEGPVYKNRDLYMDMKHGKWIGYFHIRSAFFIIETAESRRPPLRGRRVFFKKEILRSSEALRMPFLQEACRER